jgi:polysaccharide biosynthesis transport protein
MQDPKTGVVRVRRSPLALASEPEPVQVSIPASVESGKASLLHVFWRRRWTVLIVATIALIGAGVYLHRATPIYASSSRLFVERSGPQILNENQGSTVSGNSYLFTQCELIRSTPILSTAAESGALAGLAAQRKVDNPVGYLREGLEATVGKNNDIITVSFQSVDPEEAARVVNSVVDAYVTYQSTQKRSTAAEVLKILQKEKDKRDEELSDLLKQMLDFKRANAALSFQTGDGNVITQRLGSLSEALTQAQLVMIESKAALQAAEQIKDDPARLRQMAPSQLVTSIDQRQAELMGRLSVLDAELQRDRDRGVAASHPNTKVKLMEFSRLQGELEQEVAQSERRLAEHYIGSLKQDMAKTEFRVRELQKAFDEQQTSAVSLNVQSAEYAKLDAELRRTERLCEILDSRIKELNITEDVGAMNINILEVGRPEPKAVSPQKPRVFGMALVAGVVLGLGLGLLQDMRDQRLRSADEIQSLLGIPVLGIVPHMNADSTITDRGQKVHLEPVSEIAEAYRTVRTAIYFGVPEGNVKKMLVTSPAPGDGKTTSASNIAIAMAMAGQRTLIVDCDFRRPTQHKVFEIKHDVGLSSVIVGKAELAAAIQPTRVKDLFVLPCGPIPSNPSELLNSQGFADILDKLAADFDHVVIDSPPVMAVADARILAASVDLTLLVLRAEKSTRKASEHALESLIGVGANVLGCVVNDVPRGKHGNGYYGAYGYYSYYGEGQRGKGRKAISNGDHGGANGSNGNGAAVDDEEGLMIARG